MKSDPSGNIATEDNFTPATYHPEGGTREWTETNPYMTVNWTYTFISYDMLLAYKAGKYDDIIDNAMLKAALSGVKGLGTKLSTILAKKLFGAAAAEAVSPWLWGLFAYDTVTSLAKAGADQQNLELINNAIDNKTGIVITRLDLIKSSYNMVSPPEPEMIRTWADYPFIPVERGDIILKINLPLRN